MKVAIIHDWLVVNAGAERVLEQLIKVFPGATIYSTVDFMAQGERGFLQGCRVVTSFIQSLPFAKTKYRSYLPFMPLAVEQFDLSGYDLVISSSHAVAKGVLTGPDQRHVCVCYSPIRYAWDLQHQYLSESGLNKGVKGWLAKWMLHKLRIWDVRTSYGVDEFVAISDFIARRIKKVYGRESRVIYPPVNVDFFTPIEMKEDFYLTASRMVPYKKIGLIVDAFAEMPEKKLCVIGDGPDFEKIKARASTNITFLGYQPKDVLRDYLQRARAFVFAAEEDFGIAPLEAQACGTPVIAYGKGGALETIRGEGGAGRTGVFFDEQTVPSLRTAVTCFEELEPSISAQSCVVNAQRFSPERFRDEFRALLEEN
ncbi:MAG: glycosyl transferase family 1 [Desulfuromonas sp.]|nr:MAG: glycosyl transferase family 1 [Desulfuromonas sp.]